MQTGPSTIEYLRANMNLDPIEFRPVILKPRLTTLTLRVILLHHKHPLNLSGTCRIQCLIGEAQILGATLSGCDYKDGANFNTFCAPLPLPPVVFLFIFLRLFLFLD